MILNDEFDLKTNTRGMPDGKFTVPKLCSDKEKQCSEVEKQVGG